MTFYLNAGDRLPLLQTQLSDSYGAVDITSGTPVFYWRLRGNPSGSGLYSGVGTVIGDGVSGVAQYQWVTGDVAYPGVYAAKWKVNYTNGQVETFPNDGSKILFQIVNNL